MTPASNSPPAPVTLRQAIPVWAKIAALSFGGPAGQIAVMHRVLVEEKRWIGERRFLQALNFCMLLPGPEAQQLATYFGWLMHRTWGGVIAGGLFILPGFIAIMALSILYVLFGGVGSVTALFFGLKCAVLAVVLEAVVRIGRRALKNKVMVGIAAASFLAIFLFRAPFPLIVLGAGVVGAVGARLRLEAFLSGGGHGKAKPGDVADVDTLLGEATPDHAKPRLGWLLKIGGALAALWLVPVFTLSLWLGPDNVYSQIAVFFSKMAMVTFGGAYSVLSYVAQEAVVAYRWVTPKEMLDGLGLAETTPGPLIMVTQFVGFLAAYRQDSGLPPMASAILGGVLTTWVTFLPCFLWIFVGGPFAEVLRGSRVLNAALGALTAAVVGVILNLAVWFGLHTLFTRTQALLWPDLDVPVISSIDWGAAVISTVAAIALLRFKLGVIPVLGASAVAGIVWRMMSA